MVKFLVIRHGYSKSNEQGLFTGRTDVPLADTGIIQARKTARLIADNYRVDAIYSSPLLRALQTAEPLSRELGLPVVICDDLCEIVVDFPAPFAPKKAKSSPFLTRKDKSETALSVPKLLHNPLIFIISSINYPRCRASALL